MFETLPRFSSSPKSNPQLSALLSPEIAPHSSYNSGQKVHVLRGSQGNLSLLNCTNR